MDYPNLVSFTGIFTEILFATPLSGVFSTIGLIALVVIVYRIHADILSVWVPVSLVAAAVGLVAGFIVGVADFNSESADEVEAWISQTYGIDTDVNAKKLSGLSESDSPDSMTVLDGEQSYKLVLTGDYTLILTDSDGTEVPHADKE